MFESNKFKQPLCPCCKVELEIEKTYDIDCDNEGMTLYQFGYCPKCKRDYQWQSSVIFTSYANTDLKEVK